MDIQDSLQSKRKVKIMKVKLLFPGQGSQYVGMGKDIYEKYDTVKKFYEIAEEITELPVKKISFEGPEQELKKTYITQIAIYVHSVCLYELHKNEIEATAIAGHSLGEFTALYAGGVFNFEDGVRIVAKRGKLMYEVGDKIPGTMAAVIGLEREEIEKAIKDIENVVVANHNSTLQTVISGSIEGIEKASSILKEKGAKRVITLKVSGAFHSPMLKETSETFEEFLSQFEFNDSKYDVIQNITGLPERKGTNLKQGIIKQLYSPVEWVKTLNSLEKYGGNFVECGPSKVLCNLVKKTLNKGCIKIEELKKEEK